MSEKPTCGNCTHYLKNPGERRGECYLNPPTIYASGVQYRPKVFDTTAPCGYHNQIQEGTTVAVREKPRSNRALSGRQ